MKSGFEPISISEYVKKHIQSNPSVNKESLIESLNSSVEAYKAGEKCSCGNDIWVIGSSACGWSACFSCITGEAYPDDDYEIEDAL